MYAVQAIRRIVEHYGSCEVVTPVQLPTFYLDENVQGIENDGHAERIARAILGPGEYSVSAVKL